jgi:hypothetical protein
VAVRKRGGTARTLNAGSPFFNQYGTYTGSDTSEWQKRNTTPLRAYVGLYTVEVFPTTFSADQRFLVVTDVMAANDAPQPASELTCDGNSVAARCGATAVVFAKEAGERAAGNVTIPNGVTLVVVVNLPRKANRTVTAGSGLTLTTADRLASDAGVLTIGVRGGGTLQFS